MSGAPDACHPVDVGLVARHTRSDVGGGATIVCRLREVERPRGSTVTRSSNDGRRAIAGRVRDAALDGRGHRVPAARGRRAARRRAGRPEPAARLDQGARRRARRPQRRGARPGSPPGPAPGSRRRCTPTASSAPRDIEQSAQGAGRTCCARELVETADDAGRGARRAGRADLAGAGAQRRWAGRSRPPRCPGCGCARCGCTRSTWTPASSCPTCRRTSWTPCSTTPPARCRAKEGCPAVLLVPTDREHGWTLGPDADPVAVRGAAADLLGWLIGRTGRERARRPPDGVAGRRRAWLWTVARAPHGPAVAAARRMGRMPQPAGAELEAVRARRAALKEKYLRAPAERPAHHRARRAPPRADLPRRRGDDQVLPGPARVPAGRAGGEPGLRRVQPLLLRHRQPATCWASSTSPATTTPTSPRRSARCSTSRCPPRTEEFAAAKDAAGRGRASTTSGRTGASTTASTSATPTASGSSSTARSWACSRASRCSS